MYLDIVLERGCAVVHHRMFPFLFSSLSAHPFSFLEKPISTCGILWDISLSGEGFLFSNFFSHWHGTMRKKRKEKEKKKKEGGPQQNNISRDAYSISSPSDCPQKSALRSGPVFGTRQEAQSRDRCLPEDRGKDAFLARLGRDAAFPQRSSGGKSSAPRPV